MNSAKVVDLRGLACPMPIVRTKKAIDLLDSGEVLEVHVTDKGALADIPAWCASCGHVILKQSEIDSVLKFWIKKV